MGLSGAWVEWGVVSDAWVEWGVVSGAWVECGAEWCMGGWSVGL